MREGLENLGIVTPETEEKWVDEQVAKGAERPPVTVNFTIYDRSDDAPVGTAGLFDISYAHSTAEFGIAIGERRGQGLGTEATRLVLEWAFRTLGLHNVMLGRARVERGRAARVRARRLPPHRAPPRRRDEPRGARRRRADGRRARGPRLAQTRGTGRCPNAEGPPLSGRPFAL